MNAEVNDEPAEQNASPTADLHRRVEEENFGSWMIVERKNRRKSNNGQDKKLGNHGVKEGGSRISVLDGEQDMEIHSTNEDGVNKRICNDLESKELTFKAKAPGPTKKFGDRSKGRGIMVAGPKVLSEAHKLSNQQRMALLVEKHRAAAMEDNDQGESTRRVDVASVFRENLSLSLRPV
ncbi:hypothetical protein Golax_015899 [Gossypium laxum]|uniref:Uncharacterized protein n=1 Tax=Gossypium laxum TaxID=34288 RepID=A0A7J8YWU5_9ROSI|nr:hypothetical protein [Gossypium laxum]